MIDEEYIFILVIAVMEIFCNFTLISWKNVVGLVV